MPSARQDEREAHDESARRSGSFPTLLVAAVTSIVLLLMPSVLAIYPLTILSHMLVFAIACLGLNLLFGTTGLLSLGHATYFGAAAYTGAFLYRFYFVDSFESYLVCGILSSTIFAAVIGFFCVRVTRTFFAVLTLAFSMIVYSLVINGAVFRLFGGLGWALFLLGEGSMYLPRFPILSMEFAPYEFIQAFYHVIATAFVVSALVLWRISRSPFGKALRAIRDNEMRAAFIGIPVWRYRWYAFMIAGVFVGLAGSLYGQLARQITPEQLHWVFSAQLIVATVLGGSRHFLGPVVGAFLFVGLDEIASQWSVGRNLTFGLLLIIVVMAIPQGIAGAAVSLKETAKRCRRKNGVVTE
jgi:branched-chain amino acid transport system permease protein